MNAGLQGIRKTIVAGAEEPIEIASGRFFAVKEASEGTFEIAFDDGLFLPWDAGMAYSAEPGEGTFSRVTVKNTGSDPITFQILVGRGRVYDARLTVVSNRLGTVAQDGVDASGIAPPADGEGIRGWLSGIYDRLKTAGPLGVLLADLETVATSILTGVAALSAQLPSSLGAKTRAGSLSVTDATISGSILTAQTDGVDGTAFVAFSASACRTLEIVNSTAADIEYRRGGAGATIKVAAGASRKIEGIANANEISLRRVDTTTAQVTVTAEALT